MHLQLSEKYMIYKDYAERAMINPQNIGKFFGSSAFVFSDSYNGSITVDSGSNLLFSCLVKGDNRVFYIRPETIFLEDPRI